MRAAATTTAAAAAALASASSLILLFKSQVDAFVSPTVRNYLHVNQAQNAPAMRFVASNPLFATGDDESDGIDKAEANAADIDPHKYFEEGKSDSDIEADDQNTWQSVDESYQKFATEEDWEVTMTKRADGSVWSSFETSEEEDAGVGDETASDDSVVLDDGGEEAWLDALASITAEEIEFNLQEADRADKARQMEEWGFDKNAISSTLGVATDDSLETDEDNVVLETFKEVTRETGFGMYLDDEIDPENVESHTTVERDEDSGDLIRTQMVYVDEVTCIGCTNCAMIAQSTFFMDSEHGRARVFQQWGDDTETIAVAIETCPVDCIHYVPYDELVRLEVERRDQQINFKARLVNQGEYGGDSGHRIGGAVQFSGPQKISGNAGARCNNCPSRGCKNCLMYGVGENPEFKKKEEMRKQRRARKLMQEKLANENKSAEL